MMLPLTEYERELFVEALEAQEEILRRMSHDAGLSEETREAAGRDANRVAGLLGRVKELS